MEKRKKKQLDFFKKKSNWTFFEMSTEQYSSLVQNGRITREIFIKYAPFL